MLRHGMAAVTSETPTGPAVGYWTACHGWVKRPLGFVAAKARSSQTHYCANCPSKSSHKALGLMAARVR